MPVLILILLSVLLGAVAQVLLKIGVLYTGIGNTQVNLPGLFRVLLNNYVAAGVTAFAASFVLWLKVLAAVPLSYAYPMVSLGYILVFIASWLILGESLPPLRLWGLFLIIAGIFFVALS